MARQQDQRRAGHKEYPVRIFLKTLPPRKEGDVWALTAVATVVKGKYPIDGVAVQFYMDGEPKDSVVVARNGGRATKRFFLDKEGPFEVEARVADPSLPGNYVASESGHISPEKKEHAKPVVRLVCNEMPISQGRYLISFQALSEGDAPVKGAVIRIMSPDYPNGRQDLAPTGANGVAEYELGVSRRQREKSVVAVVLGTSIKKFLNFFAS